MAYRPISARRSRALPDKNNRTSSLLNELRVWIKPIVIISAILWTGHYLELSGSNPSFAREAGQYISDYNPPVSSDSVIAYLPAEAEGSRKPKALFLTPVSILYFNPNVSEKTTDSNLVGNPRLIELSIRSIASINVSKMGFMGIHFTIHGSHSEVIDFDIHNRKTADFFLEKLKELGGPVRS